MNLGVASDTPGRKVINTKRLAVAAVSSAVVAGAALPSTAGATSFYTLYCAARYTQNHGCPGTSMSDRFGSNNVWNKARNIYGHTIVIAAVYWNSILGHSHPAYNGASAISYFSHDSYTIVRGICKNGTAGNSSIRCGENGWYIIV